VREVIPWFKESHKLRLTTGAEVELSRARARALRKISAGSHIASFHQITAPAHTGEGQFGYVMM